MPATHVLRAAQSRLATVDLSNVPFSSVFSDHMLLAEFRAGAWQTPQLRPYGPLELPPNVSALQYGVSVFEGLKAHRTSRDDIVLFRPWENARRLNRSAARLAMPDVPEALFLEGLRSLIRLDRDWVPPAGKGALYIRPCLFSVDGSVRVKPAEQYAFTIFTFPFGNYYADPLDVLITERYVRAFPGGTGDVKSAGNYAASLLADQEARAAGFGTVLWLDGRERRFVEECGVMNVFFVLEDRVVTPALSGTIIPGVTRDSVITLLRDMGLEVQERRISVQEVIENHRTGRLLECFGTGTAATVSHIRRLHYKDDDLILPPVATRKVGPVVHERLVAIVTGNAPDRHGWIEHV
jgi:branched-chain amino acid aminotransferase